MLLYGPQNLSFVGSINVLIWKIFKRGPTNFGHRLTHMYAYNVEYNLEKNREPAWPKISYVHTQA